VGNLRQYVTTGVGFSFLVVGATGIVFQFFFKTKPLENIHGWLGVGLCALAIGHIFQNRKSLFKHLRQPRVFLLLIPVLGIIGFFMANAPKPAQRGINVRQIVGKLVEAPVQDVAKLMGADLNETMASMQKDGLTTTSGSESIRALADRNKRPPDQVLAYFFKSDPPK